MKDLFFFEKFYRYIYSFHSLEVKFVSDKLSQALKLRFKGYSSSYLVPKNSRDELKNSELLSNLKSVYLSSYEGKVGSITFDEAKDLYLGINIILKKEKSDKNFDHVWIWNGSNLVEKLIVLWCEKNSKSKISYAFFEIANIPGKMFIDKAGVNAKSWLYHNIDYLESLDSPSEEYFSWKRKFIEEKLQMHIVPQGRQRKAINPYFLLDRIGNFLFRRTSLSGSEDFRKMFNFFSNNIRTYGFKEEPLPMEFIFFPMQVSSDTQCLINSELSLVEAFDKVYEIAANEGVSLVVKPHPAEKNWSLANNLITKFAAKGVIFSNQNTFHLISKSLKIVTINSSVGLEAKILGKSVVCLGNAIYESMTTSTLDKYLCNYLYEFDYFSQKFEDKSGLLFVENFLNDQKNVKD